MITCRDDLIGTYIKNDQGELRDLYLSEITKHGVKICSGHDFKKLVKRKFIGVHNYGLWPQCDWSDKPFIGEKEITMKDLKQRTKIDFVKVASGAAQKIELLMLGERLYTNRNGTSWIDWNRAKMWSLGDIDRLDLYRKVERQVDCFDDAVNLLNQTKGFDAFICYDGGLWIGIDDGIDAVGMCRDKWSEFARIILGKEEK